MENLLKIICWINFQKTPKRFSKITAARNSKIIFGRFYIGIPETISWIFTRKISEKTWKIFWSNSWVHGIFSREILNSRKDFWSNPYQNLLDFLEKSFKESVGDLMEVIPRGFYLNVSMQHEKNPWTIFWKIPSRNYWQNRLKNTHRNFWKNLWNIFCKLPWRSF